MRKHRCGRALFHMNLLFLNGYNNYFNRKLKKQDFIEDYIRNYNYEIRSEVNRWDSHWQWHSGEDHRHSCEES